MTPFVILGAQRTGTTFIGSMLDSHPQVRCYAEAFRSVRVRKSTSDVMTYAHYLEHVWWRRLGDRVLRARMVRRYLDEVFATPGYEAVGFKFMHNHLARFPMVLEDLHARDTRFIHVVRYNALKVHLSRVAAHARGTFGSLSAVQQAPVRLDTRDLLPRLEQVRSEILSWKNLVAQDPNYLQVSYERFVRDPLPETRRLLEFLGVRNQRLNSRMVKLSTDDLTEAIENYDAVRRCLRGSSFESCLN